MCVQVFVHFAGENELIEVNRRILSEVNSSCRRLQHVHAHTQVHTASTHEHVHTCATVREQMLARLGWVLLDGELDSLIHRSVGR